MSKPKLTDPEEWAIIRKVYFNTDKPNEDMDEVLDRKEHKTVINQAE